MHNISTNKFPALAWAIAFLVAVPLSGNGQEAYELNWSDTTTFTVDCGTVNPAQWTVKNDSCNYSSPNIYAGIIDETIDLTIRINQSGNLTTDDMLYISILENDIEQISIVASGDSLDAVFTIDTALLVEAGNYMTITIAMRTSHSTRFYQIKNGDIFAGYNTPLPVTLASFTGSVKGDLVQLAWVTASEEQNDYFTVQRSTAGSAYKTIGKVDGNGTTSQMHRYVYTDRPGPVARACYRILQTDYDGTVKLIGRPLSFRLEVKPAVRLYPNPLPPATEFTLVTAGYTGAFRIRIFDHTGLKVFDRKQGIRSVATTLPGTANLPPGLYFIFVEGEELSFAASILKL